MENKTYNGRSNRETRLVWLHFEINSIDDLQNAKDYIKEIEEWIDNNFLRDFVDFSKINWIEIEENLLEEIELESK